MKLYADSLIEALPEVGSGSLLVRSRVIVRVCLVVKQPAAIGVLSGTGCAAPVFS